jgi:sigma54-dependent transcription regulator
VELDDQYHYRDDRIARDVFVDDLFRDCSIQLFRIDIPIKRIRPEDIGHVLDYVLEYFTPVCKECGGFMSYKKSTRSYNYGHRFYGCNNWIPGGDGCNFTIDID